MTPGQCRAARILLSWTIANLAKRAAVSMATVERFEAGKTVPRGAPESMRYRFEAVGIHFEDNWGVSYRPRSEYDKQSA